MKGARGEEGGSRFAKEIGRKEGRLLAGRPAGDGRLSTLGTIGIIGWTITLPMLAGIALGRWIDGLAGGRWSFTVMLMVGGLFLGCATAWNWVSHRLGLGKGKGSAGGGEAKDARGDKCPGEEP